MEITIINKSKHRVPRRNIEVLVNRLFKLTKARPRELAVVFVRAATSKKLNKKYRKKNYPTDVLSFEGDKTSMGELVLCPQVLKQQAKEHGQSFNKECDLMIIHGFLHLLGYDHEKSLKEERRMTKIQTKLFKKLSRP